MSIFQVNLNNRSQGLLDVYPVNNVMTQLMTSRQRTIYVMGPGKVNRKLKDGDTFQDCNYYKRFCYPQVSLEDAILTILSDDNSVWSVDSTENTFPYTFAKTVFPGTTFAQNQFDILTDTGGYATFLQITNDASATDVQVRLNGLTTAIFTLERASFQVFNAGDLQISMVEVANNLSGAQAVNIEILCAVRSICNT